MTDPRNEALYKTCQATQDGTLKKEFDKMTDPMKKMEEILQKFSTLCVAQHMHHHDLDGHCKCSEYITQAQTALLALIREVEEGAMPEEKSMEGFTPLGGMIAEYRRGHNNVIQLTRSNLNKAWGRE